MNERIEQELALLRSVYPGIEWHPDSLWLVVPSYVLPDGIWDHSEIELAIQMPPNLPGQQPYGFWVRPNLTLKNGKAPENYSFPVQVPLGEDWGQFSWAPITWEPQADIAAGSNMLNFVRSIADRLREAS
jgi:hypothetical protein